tara:strand:- start:271 stop:1053 length:783 start_codon:yes stop_codon:yes gene_type:complete
MNLDKLPELYPKDQMKRVYRILSLVNSWINIKVVNPDNLEVLLQDEPVVVTMNHPGVLETILGPFNCYKFMKEQEGFDFLYENFMRVVMRDDLGGEQIKKFLRPIGGIEIDQKNRNAEPLNFILKETLDKGKSIVLFPEGLRNPKRKKFKPGFTAGYLAFHSKIPPKILPIYVHGDTDNSLFSLRTPSLKRNIKSLGDIFMYRFRGIKFIVRSPYDFKDLKKQYSIPDQLPQNTNWKTNSETYRDIAKMMMGKIYELKPK